MDVAWRWLGTVPYVEAHARQVAFRAEVIAGERGELWLLEHPPVITLGRRGGDVDREAARRAGFEVVATERGGLATCHEPGQLVGYLIADVRHIGVRRLVSALEEGICAYVAGCGIAAGRREGFPGIWVGTDKICAIGLHVRLGVTMHGFALNLTNDRTGFSLISPCGIRDGGVTTLGVLHPDAATPDAAAPAVARTVLDALSRLQ